MGIYRHILFYMEKKKASIDEILGLLEKRWDGIMLKESKDVGRADYEYIVNFFKVLKKELGKGED